MQKLSTSGQLGHLLIARRKSLGLTQSDVAARLGISQNRLSELESRPAQLTVDRLLTLTGILGLELTLLDQEKAAPPTSAW